MTIAETIEALNERKTSALNDPERRLEGQVLDYDWYRAVLVGLDLDLMEAARVAGSCADHVSVTVQQTGLSLRNGISQLALDMFVAGVFYERERTGAPASGG